MSIVKEYTSVVPKSLYEKLRENGMPALLETYAQVFDWLSRKGIKITLLPFFTFALAGNTAYTWQIFIPQKEKGTARIIKEEDEFKGGSFGGSFGLTANAAIERAVLLLKETDTETRTCGNCFRQDTRYCGMCKHNDDAYYGQAIFDYFLQKPNERQDHYENCDCDDCVFSGEECRLHRNPEDKCKKFFSYTSKTDNGISSKK